MHLAGGPVSLHEDNQAACNVLVGLTSRSPEMMAELRKLWHLLDSNGVHIRARYIRSAANVCADRLSRHLDSDEWQLDPVLIAELEAMWGAHSVDRGASATVVAPRWEGKCGTKHLPRWRWRSAWYCLIAEIFFRPGRRAGRDLPGTPR
eukprot:jgi/Tetstr1/445728/TSEL_033376.t1